VAAGRQGCRGPGASGPEVDLNADEFVVGDVDDDDVVDEERPLIRLDFAPPDDMEVVA
jgi:hypothetical protein